MADVFELVMAADPSADQALTVGRGTTG